MNAMRLVPRALDDQFARVGTKRVSTGAFLADVLACADALPTQPYCINLCHQRYGFMVVFFAAIARGQTNLLPAKRTAAALRDLQQAYPNSYRIGDTDDSTLDQRYLGEAGANGSAASPFIDPTHVAAVAFTSGSTGSPKAHGKTWAMLCAFRDLHWQQLSSSQTRRWGLVATVPAWHMYGLEWAMMLPSAAPITVHCGADFFPSDVVSALDAFHEETNHQPMATLLVATPTHLKSLLNSIAPQIPVSRTLCATAPLDDNLCEQASEKLNTQILEIYGCSEIGTLAWRDRGSIGSAATSPEPPGWQFFPGFDVLLHDSGALPLDAAELEAAGHGSGYAMTVRTEYLPNSVSLSDRFVLHPDGGYQLLGRTTDMIKVAGKRESLAHLNAVLTNIPGVIDGLVYDPANFGYDNNGRLAALLVAPDLTDGQLRKALSTQIDAAFLPRPLRRVDQLPREATGKLPRQAIAALLQHLGEHTNNTSPTDA